MKIKGKFIARNGDIRSASSSPLNRSLKNIQPHNRIETFTVLQFPLRKFRARYFHLINYIVFFLQFLPADRRSDYLVTVVRSCSTDPFSVIQCFCCFSPPIFVRTSRFIPSISNSTAHLATQECFILHRKHVDRIAF